MIEDSNVNEFFTISDAEINADGLVELAVIPLRGTVIFPNAVTPITINNERTIAGVRHALEKEMTVIVVAQQRLDADNPQPDDLYKIGTETAIGRMWEMRDGTYSLLSQGRRRVEILNFKQTDPFIIAQARPLGEKNVESDDTHSMMQVITSLFKRAVELNESIPNDVLDYVMEIKEPGWLADLITSTLTLPQEDRQRVLETLDTAERLQRVALLLGQELNMLELKDEINNQIQQEFDKGQREMYLREQMRIIQNELGEDDIFQEEINELHEQIEAANLPDEVHERATKELARLAAMPPIAPEVSIIRNYIDWIVALPWTQMSDDNLDVTNAQRVLDQEHYGLPDAKDRVLEYIAVRKLAGSKMKSPILCFVGPPGVGKTSLGKSIATALGREFVRVSLGGVRDEAEIRGHRRTYIGAMPGRIVQTLRRAGTVNPVFMLDEIDKLGADFRGDPADALLEVLDPEQNHAFSDHYLEVPFDLSKVLFVTTANDLYPLPDALLDRLEVIEFPGYVEEEKLEIARKFLIPRQLDAHGIADTGLLFETAALQNIVREYTYEAGVRNMDREIAKVCRKVARLVAEGKKYPKRIRGTNLHRYLGPPEWTVSRANDEDEVGVVNGLAWTSGGGDTLTIEVSLLPGKGNLTLTGQLGEVMQESAQAAMSYMRSRADDLDVPHDDFENYDVHVHLPEGSVPKEGPSAGITLAIAIISVFTECKVRSNFAMSGEITLRGKVLPVGGIKEKVLAARRARIPNVILPDQNEKDLVNVPKQALRDLNITFVDNMQQVMDLVLLEPPSDGRKRDLDRDDDEDENEDADQENNNMPRKQKRDKAESR